METVAAPTTSTSGQPSDQALIVKLVTRHVAGGIMLLAGLYKAGEVTPAVLNDWVELQGTTPGIRPDSRDRLLEFALSELQGAMSSELIDRGGMRAFEVFRAAVLIGTFTVDALYNFLEERSPPTFG